MFRVGDVVARVRHPFHSEEFAPPMGKPVRVDGVECSDNVPGLLFAAYPSPHYSGAWRAEHFRKILPASPDFTAQIRACRPAHSKSPVSA